VRGRLKVKWLAPEVAVDAGATLYLDDGGAPESLRVAAVSTLNPPFLLVTVDGCTTVERAEGLRGASLWMAKGDLPELEEDSYYVDDLVGMRVETAAGAPLGEVAEVVETGAADVYVVRGEGGELLLPATREVVRRVDLEARLIVVTPLPGMVV